MEPQPKLNPNLPQEGFFIVQPRKGVERPLPDGSEIVLATDKKDITSVYHKSSEFSKGNVYMYNAKTEEVTLNGKKAGTEELRRMKELIDYFEKNMKDEDAETIVLPEIKDWKKEG